MSGSNAEADVHDLALPLDHCGFDRRRTSVRIGVSDSPAITGDVLAVTLPE